MNEFIPVAKRHLLLANALVWGLPGIRILVTGIQSYLTLPASGKIPYLAVGSVAVFCAFTWMFGRIVRRYSDRIMDFPGERKSLLSFLPPRGWVLVFFMMCLGISLKFIPGIPAEFFASFYCGLGTALLVAGAQFLSRWVAEGRR